MPLFHFKQEFKSLRDLCFVFQLQQRRHYISVPLRSMRVIMQRFIVMRLVILCPVLSGSEKIQGKVSRMIVRLSCGPSIATILDDISALPATSLETIPRTVQLELIVS